MEFNQPIKELATNPLLLALLCLEFEDSGDFPSDRSELYRRGIITLLRKWDNQRGIARDQIYKNLSIQRKEDLLSQIACTTFGYKAYFFKQREIEKYIADYIRNLPDSKTDSEALQVDSEVILKSIEAQHGLLIERARGIYSFSHLTFQEYFTARRFLSSCNPYSIEDESLLILASHISEKRWREVLLLAVEMLPSADCLMQLMKQNIDILLSFNQKTQEFLCWLSRRESLCDFSYSKLDFLRCYSDNEDSYTADYLNNTELETDWMLIQALQFCSQLSVCNQRDLNHNLKLYDFLNSAIEFTANTNFKNTLCHFKYQLPDVNLEKGTLKGFWKRNGRKWLNTLLHIMNKYRFIDIYWNFQPEEKILLKQYYTANKLLLDCLKSDCYVSREIRQ